MTLLWILMAFWIGGFCGFALFAALKVSHDADVLRQFGRDAMPLDAPTLNRQ